MNLIERIERLNMKKDVPAFNIGDDVKIHIKVVEGDKERIQVFEGIIIAKDGSMNRETFTVRKVSYGVGVERVFPIHSPKIEKIEVVKSNRVKRAKLYFLRGRSGKAARFVEKERFFVPGKESIAAKAAAAEVQTATPDEGAAQK
ncbi:MAG: 50S ribosomal protein L19 [Nitrospirota bacterium]